MKWIERKLEKQIFSLVGRNKVVLLWGTRRVGKTALIKRILESFAQDALWMNGEDFDVQEILKNRSVANYGRLIGNARLLVIDEAQAVPEIGQVLKLMIDHLPHLTIIATGSSSFDLSNKTGDPLTGRSISLQLFPLSQSEISAQETVLETVQHLEERLIFGSYPELFQYPGAQEKSEYLQHLVQSYLLKDIMAFEGIRQSDKIIRLLRLIAFQCGSEVSYQELATQLGISKNTVERYLDLLSKVFIIHRLGAYNTNQRKEVSKSSKWYFFDTGIRNAIINDFKSLPLRNDLGQLWENYVLSERIKKNTHERSSLQYYFWRNYNQQEVDMIEESSGQIQAFEFKYVPVKKSKIPPAFATTYPGVTLETITRENYMTWIT
jgi:uncharacterized protein